MLDLSGIVTDSIVDGPGIRVTVFAQGCPHHCQGCHNPETWDFEGGTPMDTQMLANIARSNPLCRGVTFSGGEPFAQAEDCLALAQIAHANKLNVWSYSGWTFEHLRDHGSDAQKALLQELDVLVDGPFLLEKRTLSLPWRGSPNQRVIDVKASLAAGDVVIIPD